MLFILTEEVMTEYSNMLFKICLVILGNEHDAQDAVQDTFYRYLNVKPAFFDIEHQKAWFIRVAVNISKDMRRFQRRHLTVSMDWADEYYTTAEDKGILEELIRLPNKLKIVVYLHYIEGYQIKEIASMLNISASAVKKRLQRGREQLKLLYEGKE